MRVERRIYWFGSKVSGLIQEWFRLNEIGQFGWFKQWSDDVRGRVQSETRRPMMRMAFGLAVVRRLGR